MTTPYQLFGIGSNAMRVANGVGYGITEEPGSDSGLAFLPHSAGLNNGIHRTGTASSIGDEIDRLDYDLGTPRNADIIATSKLAGGRSMITFCSTRRPCL